VAGHQAVPVEDAGNQIIIGDENQLADGGEHVGGDAVALSAAALLLICSPAARALKRVEALIELCGSRRRRG
jgi:hypothetical protein